MFGPSLEQVAAVENALRAAGLSPGPVAPDRLSIPVTATAAAVEHAFGVTLDRYRLAGGQLGKVLATVAASCRATACTVTVPAETARTVDIKIFASSLWSSPLTAKDRYHYVKA